MTNINEDDKGDCDYQNDLDDWGGWDDQDHRHCNGDFGDQDDQGGWHKVNDSIIYDWATQDDRNDWDTYLTTKMAKVTMMNL